MKRKKAIDFLLVTLFAGILFTFTVIIGLGGTLKEGSLQGNSFNERFYGDNALSDFVKYVDYKVFGHIEEGDILIGRDEWLFEAIDSENGYERLRDYIGANQFSDEQLEKIISTVSKRAEKYESNGIRYMMVVIPDSISVCSENTPWYLGKQSDNTRLSQLTRLASERGIDGFINPTQIMISESKNVVMYNNTENTINAYGAYCIYNTVVSRFLAETGREVDRIYRDDVDFYTRITDGRRIAELAGLSETINNRTVSVSDEMTEEYQVKGNEKNLVKTVRDNIQQSGTRECVVIECTSDWDRIQLTPYFSNTFETVYYRELSVHPNDASQYEPTLVVQIIHESELEMLLE